MRPDDIAADMVRQALGAIRSARPLAGSPLLGLDALAEASAAMPGGSTPAARTTFLRGWLEVIAWEQLTRLRGRTVTEASPRPGPAGAMDALAADFRADSADREAWGILYFHYFSGSSATRGQVATAVGVGYNTVRRRLERGHELLAAELRERERSAAMASERAHNVPRPPSRFIGREAELGAIRAQMANHRLVVLTGPGGIGKSRLAIRLAQDLAADYPDGSWFAELATVLDGHRVAQAVLGAMGQREVPGQTLLATLTAILAERRMLLVLDNCEHVASACAELLDHLLPRCPALEVLATSREQLAVPGAAHWPVPPLALPAAEQEATVGALIHFDGPRLFSARAAVAEPGFALTDATAGPVGRICAQLDGIPLALEMAAGRLGELSLARIEAGLVDRFGLLVDGRRASRPGHETLRATMDWSYDLLSEPERRLFRRLAVFRGGFTLEAVKTVCASECGGFQVPSVEEIMGALEAGSLVYFRDHGNGDRYWVLETIREYAQLRLADEIEPTLWPARHLAHFASLATGAAALLHGPDQSASLDRLDQDRANILCALEWAIATSSFQMGAQLANAMSPYWYVRGEWSEGLRTTRALLDCDDPPSVSSERARMLHFAGRFAFGLNAHDEARRLWEEGLALAEALGDPAAAARCLNSQAVQAETVACDWPAARKLYEQALEAARASGDRRLEAAILYNLGVTANTIGQSGEARRLMEMSLAIDRELGDPHSLAETLGGLANVHFDLRDYATARALCQESLEILRGLGAKPLTGTILGKLGMCIYHEGTDPDYAQAGRLFTESVALNREVGDMRALVNALNGLARVHTRFGDMASARRALDESLSIAKAHDATELVAAALDAWAFLHLAEGTYECAVRQMGSVQALCESVGVSFAFESGRDSTAIRDMADRTLGEAACQAALAEGALLTRDEAIAYALGELTWEALRDAVAARAAAGAAGDDA